jgi:hypothetical protein
MNLRKWLVISFLLLLSFTIAFFFATTFTHVSNESHIYCYSKSEQQYLESLSNYFKKHSDWKVVFHDINQSASLNVVLNITKRLSLFGVEFIPSIECPCDRGSTYDEILIRYGSPLIGFFHNDRLTAITVGVTINETLDKALIVNDEGVKVFTAFGLYSLGNESRTQLQEFFDRL